MIEFWTMGGDEKRLTDRADSVLDAPQTAP